MTAAAYFQRILAPRAVTSARPDIVDAMVLSAAVLVVFAAGVLSAQNYPAYYEDESWVFTPVFEFLRGNGFSMQAFGDRAPALLFVFSLFVTPLVAASPFEAETTVRLIAALGFSGLLLAAYFAARRFSPHSAILAPVFLLAVPLLFLSLRYGRPEAIGIPVSIAALAITFGGRAFAGGVVAGLAVSIHPLQLWIGAPAAVAVFGERRWRGLRDFVLGGMIGVAPQLIWIAAHFDAIREFSQRYFVSSSLAPGRIAVIDSLLAEPARYLGYVQDAPLPDLALQAILFLVLPAIAVLSARGKQRAVLIALVVAPLIVLALLAQNKTPSYLGVAIPALAIVAASGARRVPRRAALLICAALLVAVVMRHAQPAHLSGRQLRAHDVTRTVAAEIPSGSAVFSPLVSAGMILRRPDLRFFSYHALSVEAGGWRFPACEALPGRLAELVHGDVRRLSVRVSPPDAIYLVWDAAHLLPHLQAIYGALGVEEMDCLVASDGSETRTLHVCGRDQASCADVNLTRIPMPAEPAG